MKLFNDITSAINYRTNCPLCVSKLYINEEELAEYYYGPERKLHFYIDQRYQDKCIIDPTTGQVELSITETAPQTITPGFHGSIAAYTAPPPKNYSISGSRFLHALHIECRECCHYGFTLQVHIDLKKSILNCVVLNSESITVTEDGKDHEIRNVYTSLKTEYSCHGVNQSGKMISIPLIDVDFSNPLEAVSRIKKLIIFS